MQDQSGGGGCVSTGKVEQREEGNVIKSREESGEDEAKKRKKLSGRGAGFFFSFLSFFFSHKGFRTFSSIINALLLKFK